MGLSKDSRRNTQYYSEGNKQRKQRKNSKNIGGGFPKYKGRLEICTYNSPLLTLKFYPLKKKKKKKKLDKTPNMTHISPRETQELMISAGWKIKVTLTF